MSIYKNYARLLTESAPPSHLANLTKLVNDAIAINAMGSAINKVLLDLRYVIEEKHNSATAQVMTDYDATYTFDSVFDINTNDGTYEPLDLQDVFLLTVKNGKLEIHYGDNEVQALDQPFIETYGFTPVKQIIERIK